MAGCKTFMLLVLYGKKVVPQIKYHCENSCLKISAEDNTDNVLEATQNERSLHPVTNVVE